MPAKALAALSPGTELILSPSRMAQVLVEYKHSSWNYARVHPLQYVEGRAVQVAVDIGKGQRLIVVFLVAIIQRFKERGDCVLEQTYVPRNLALNVGNRSAGRVSTCRLIAPCLRNTSEGIEACVIICEKYVQMISSCAQLMCEARDRVASSSKSSYISLDCLTMGGKNELNSP